MSNKLEAGDLSQATETLPLVLVVDDDTRNAKLVACSLATEGYQTIEAADGADALARILERRPDLILLDIMMPGIDGFEVCRRLRADEDTRDIPVILFTALNDPADKVRGLDLGADAFLSKPIERVELLAHVRTHFRIKQLRDEVIVGRQQLEAQNDKLRDLERLRNDLTHMLVHDLKNPLAAILLKLELMRDYAHKSTPEKVGRQLGELTEAADKIQMLVQNILDVSRLEEAEVNLQLGYILFDDLLQKVREEFSVFEAVGANPVTIDVPANLPTCIADVELISRVIENLVSNAIKLSTDGDISIVVAATEDDGIILSVADRGPGVPDHMREAIFDKFSASEARRSGVLSNHGLGLTFSKLAIEAHGGSIWVEPRDGGGSIFKLLIPKRVQRDLASEAPELASQTR